MAPTDSSISSLDTFTILKQTTGFTVFAGIHPEQMEFGLALTAVTDIIQSGLIPYDLIFVQSVRLY